MRLPADDVFLVVREDCGEHLVELERERRHNSSPGRVLFLVVGRVIVRVIMVVVLDDDVGRGRRLLFVLRLARSTGSFLREGGAAVAAGADAAAGTSAAGFGQRGGLECRQIDRLLKEVVLLSDHSRQHGSIHILVSCEYSLRWVLSSGVSDTHRFLLVVFLAVVVMMIVLSG